MRLALAALAHQGSLSGQARRHCIASALRLGLTLPFFLFASLFAGCRSATVSNVTAPAAAEPVVVRDRPAFVYVGDFDLGAADFQPSHSLRPLSILRQNNDPSQQIAGLQDLLTGEIVKDLNQAGIPAGRLDPASARPTAGWLVSGEFLEVSEGNRLVRAVVGFGAGDSSAKLYVTLADLAHPEGQNLLTFDSDTNGAKTPGGGVIAVATHTPWGMVAKYAIDRNPTEKDMEQIAKAIAGEIIEYAGAAPGN